MTRIATDKEIEETAKYMRVDIAERRPHPYQENLTTYTFEATFDVTVGNEKCVTKTTTEIEVAHAPNLSEEAKDAKARKMVASVLAIVAKRTLEDALAES